MTRRSALKTLVMATTALSSDIGHTPGTLRYFSEYLPDVTVTCWLRKTNADVTGMLQQRFPKVTFLDTGHLKNTGEASTPELQQAFDS